MIISGCAIGIWGGAYFIKPIVIPHIVALLVNPPSAPLYPTQTLQQPEQLCTLPCIPQRGSINYPWVSGS